MISLGVATLLQLVVGPGGDYRSLGPALAAARAGDTVVVQGGRYQERETLRIERPVVILGRNWPRIVGEGNHTLIVVAADHVTIQGLALSNVDPSSTYDRAAIRLEGARACRIVGNEITDAYFGIHGSKVTDCTIADNRIDGHSAPGHEQANAIHLWSSDRVRVERNDVTGHRDGLYLEFVKSSRLAENRSHGNRRYGMHFMFSDSCSYEDNIFSENGVGVAVMYSRNVRMLRNRFEDNRGQAAYGLLLKDINDSEIAENRFDRNTVALYLEGSNRQRVRGNYFASNGWAVRVLANATDNVFEANTFIGNAFDVATNSRSATSRFSGNYWDRYRGYDRDRDGVGDVPFRPVRLFALVVERHEPALALLRSLFVDLLDQAERLLPILTPVSLIDARPLMVQAR